MFCSEVSYQGARFFYEKNHVDFCLFWCDWSILYPCHLVHKVIKFYFTNLFTNFFYFIHIHIKCVTKLKYNIKYIIISQFLWKIILLYIYYVYNWLLYIKLFWWRVVFTGNLSEIYFNLVTFWYVLPGINKF